MVGYIFYCYRYNLKKLKGKAKYMALPFFNILILPSIFFE